MSQIEVSKATSLVALGPDSDEVAVSKVTMFFILVPSGAEDDDAYRAVTVNTRIIRRS